MRATIDWNERHSGGRNIFYWDDKKFDLKPRSWYDSDSVPFNSADFPDRSLWLVSPDYSQPCSLIKKFRVIWANKTATNTYPPVKQLTSQCQWNQLMDLQLVINKVWILFLEYSIKSVLNVVFCASSYRYADQSDNIVDSNEWGVIDSTGFVVTQVVPFSAHIALIGWPSINRCIMPQSLDSDHVNREL